MQVKDVQHGRAMRYHGKNYVRVNASRNVVPRDEGQAVLMNTENGKLLIVSKQAETDEQYA